MEPRDNLLHNNMYGIAREPQEAREFQERVYIVPWLSCALVHVIATKQCPDHMQSAL